MDVRCYEGKVKPQVGQYAQGTHVLERVMGCPHDAISVTAAVPDELDGKLVQAEVMADLLVRAEHREHRHAVHPREVPFAREACGERDCVLFCDAGVDEALTERFGDTLESHVAEVSRDEHE